MRRKLLGGTALRYMIAGVMALGVAGYANGAAAQMADTDAKARGQKPGEKTSDTRPEFTRLGAFVLQAKTETALTYDDNIYVDPNNEQDDLIVTIAPRLDIKSNFARHGLSAYVYGDGNIFTSSSDDTYVNFGLGTEGVIDIARVWKVVAGVSYDNLNERRGRDDSTGVIDAPDEPVNYDRYKLYLESHTRFAKGKFVGGLSYTASAYDNVGNINPMGNPIVQDDRDRSILAADARLTLDLFDLYSPFFEATIEGIDYDKGDFAGGSYQPTLERDGERYRVLAGVDIDLTGVLFGSMAVGYGSRTFDSSTFETIDGFEWELGLTWLPTQLTAIDFNLSRDVGETTLGGASGFYSTETLLALSQEVTRDVTFGAHVGYALREYEGANRDDDTWRAGLGATYDINRNFDLNARYEFMDRASDVSTFDYSRNLISVTFTAKL